MAAVFSSIGQARLILLVDHRDDLGMGELDVHQAGQRLLGLDLGRAGPLGDKHNGIDKGHHVETVDDRTDRRSVDDNYFKGVPYRLHEPGESIAGEQLVGRQVTQMSPDDDGRAG